MLVIRPNQLEVFRAAARESFVDAMVAHLADFTPPLYKTLGPDATREAVRWGMEQAAGYGFRQRGPVRLYLELMVLFGSRFATDPQYPWAAAILADQDAASQMRRARTLHRHVLKYRQAVAGPGDGWTLRALRNIRAWAAGPIDFAPDRLVPTMLDVCTAIYPEKAAYVGHEALTALIRKGGQGARNQRFTSPRAMALVVVLMLAFGHGCGTDPFYPWITRTLRDERFTDPAARAARLEQRALTWLERVLVNLETPS